MTRKNCFPFHCQQTPSRPKTHLPMDYYFGWGRKFGDSAVTHKRKRWLNGWMIIRKVFKEKSKPAWYIKTSRMTFSFVSVILFQIYQNPVVQKYIQFASASIRRRVLRNNGGRTVTTASSCFIPPSNLHHFLMVAQTSQLGSSSPTFSLV